MTSFLIQQKITAFANQYRIFESADGHAGQLLAFAHQKRLALRENIIFYKDETKQEVLFQLKTPHVIEIAATYEVYDDQDNALGRLKKEFSASLVRSTWHIYSPQQETPCAIAQERNLPTALLRRVWGFVPFIGELPFILKYHFDFIDPADKSALGNYTKVTLFRDHYRLDASKALLEKCDWRVLVALGVCLDALQSR
ncbi:MAG TPA: hypothetical protein VJ836_01630 [Candidatus Saccharimonadales bacterium]|nr:hypothetical protein [Candidatus Saccharimonadales bacterium]